VCVIVWSFRPRAGSQRRFEEAYGPGGGWSMLFRGSPDYLGTELLRAADGSERYLTVDRWRSAEAYEAFLATRRREYDALDRECEGLTESEELVGRFDHMS
jgi:heme-degrading monooxygenase HmoA